ncbi:hypothetical protein [uncultured Hydrogenophaga sp.]|uniref:hypothetical protein n=1 Tax=uncultured Hydrogenophaga sp. TaxID=199683 RepID=UPI0026604B76|nr:hypothetical protein [uncultured Hydrogenophaga sp.]
MTLKLVATFVDHSADTDPAIRWKGRWLEVIDITRPRLEKLAERCEPKYLIMCQAITSDIQTAGGSGVTALREIQMIEKGEKSIIKSEGNAWITCITPTKVWFEGLYEQSGGDALSFAQYKTAVEAYVRFLSNPEGTTIEVAFPDI